RYHAAGLGRFRISATTDPRPAVARDTPAEIESLLLIPEAQRTAEQQERLFRHYLLVALELAKERAAIDVLRKEMPAYPTTLSLQERPRQTPRPPFAHNRGESPHPVAGVDPALPAALPPLPEGSPRDRLGLARWLVSADTPLVGRVTVNRQWAA